MKKKLLCITLVTCLVLSVVMPGTALAAKGKAFDDFEATGFITFIDDGIVKPAGQSGRWVVSERHIMGIMLGDVNGDFTLTYAANVDSDQAGNFHDELVVGSYVFKVRGKSEPIQFQYVYDKPGFGLVAVNLMETNGGWTLIEGAHGNGEYYGSITIEVALEGPYQGHIVGMPDASVSMLGKWKQ
ncbi:MAG: hypothetical protein ISS55_03325 [Dehalococcoidales bacterium]|nr:hypothetical protein [Dehalococcoidales bacterium]